MNIAAQIKRALASGELTRQPCEVCGTTKMVEGHHRDYRRPLDVRWLCKRHHRAAHRRNPKLKRYNALTDRYLMWRRRHRLTQEQAARAAGVTLTAWRTWERDPGSAGPNLAIILKLNGRFTDFFETMLGRQP